MRKGAMLLLAVALWLPAGAGAASPPGALAQLGSGFGCQVDEGQAPVAPCVAGVRGIDTPTDLALSPDGFSAYVAGAESDAIAVFDRDPGTGALFQKPGTAGCIVEEPSPNIAGCANVARALDRPTNVAVSPDGTHVYVTATDSNSVVTFDRDVFTGVLTQKSGSEGCIVDTPSPDVPGCNNAGTGLTGAAGIALDGFGTTVYVAGRLSNSVSILDRDTSTGALSQKAGANGCIVDEPSVDIGGCDNTARGMTGPFRLTVSPSDTSVYLIALDNSSLVTFDRDPADGTLQQKAGAAGCSVASADADCQIVRAMTAPQSLATAGASVYVAASGSDAIAVFDRAGDGTLTQDSGPPGCVVDEPAGDISNCDNSGRGLDEPFAVATSLDGRNVYAAGGDDAIAVFDRNSTNGDLTQKSGTAGCLGDDTGCAPAAGTGDIVDFALPFNGRSVLGVGVQSDALLAFRRDVVPTCTPLSPTVQHNEPAALALTCTDLNNDPITISIETPPANGSVTLNGNRAVYTPNAGHVGADSFTYKATANGAESDPATVTADVLPGRPPVCAPRSQPVRPGATTPLALTCAAGGDPFTMAVATAPANGTLGAIDQSTGLVPYTPNGSFSGPDSFTYTATSAFGTSAPAVFALDVFAPPADRLAVALFQRALRARPRARVRLRYVATLAANVELVVRRGSRRVARRTGRARVGANALRFRAGRAGLYRLTLTAVNGEQRVTQRASLRVTKRRPRS